MNEELYKIVFTGKPLPGFEAGEMKKNLASIFKLPLEDIERRFPDKPVIIKSGIDLQAAEKFRSAMQRAGAECKILPLSDTPPAAPQPSSEKSDQPPQAEQKVQEPVRLKVISPIPKPVSLQYTPLPCRSITAAEGGLNFNRYSCERVLFADILLLSVFNMPLGAKFKTNLLVFMKKQKKSLLTEADSIRYEDFPGTRDSDEYASLRNFIHLFLDNNPEIIIDESTNAFLNGSSPVTLKKGVDFFSSALGAVLDSENLFELPVMTGTKVQGKPESHTVPTSKENDSTEQKTKQEIPVYTEEEYLALFIGPNADKYLTNFRNFSGSGGFRATWHWPAFLVPFFWLLYRKLYLYAIAVFFLGLIPFLNIFMHIAMGISAYYIYYKYTKSSLSRLKKYEGSYEITSDVVREGGVSSAPPLIGAAVVTLSVAVVIAGVSMKEMIKSREDAVNEIMRGPVIIPTLPGSGNGPGSPSLQQTVEQLAYDTKAMAELKNTCTMAQMFFSEEHDATLSLEELRRRYGFSPPADIEIKLIDPSVKNLKISARHKSGSKTFYADDRCSLTE